VKLLDQLKIKIKERGQILALVAILIPIVIIFVGIAIDLGRAYVTKTTLSKAVDAAALAAMRNLNQGQTAATNDAKSAFTANYQSGPGLGTTPTPSITWFTNSPCTAGNTCVTIAATAVINTTFLRALSILPGVGSSYNSSSILVTATAQRNPLVMSIVLDKSGSMNKNGGSTALPPAVTSFISYFDEGIDNIAEISFSTVASTDVSMTTSFDSPINSAVENLSFGGATFAQSGLQAGYTQIQSIPPTPNVIRVAVFFTDGWANTNNDNLNCTGTAAKPVYTNVNYGGCSPTEAGFAQTLDGTTISPAWCSGVSFLDPSSGNSVSCPNSNPANSGYKTTATFPAQEPGMSGALYPCCGNAKGDGQYDITNDATYRTETLATSMRTATNPVTIYSIGLGNTINEAYLQDIANDPSAPTYNSAQPQGEAVFAPTATQLDAVFQTIASKVLLRLSQ
jgi:Flp pilus assembly protein TadG